MGVCRGGSDVRRKRSSAVSKKQAEDVSSLAVLYSPLESWQTLFCVIYWEPD
jgi:hypothetical protein